MTRLSFDLAGPALSCGAVVSIPVLAAALAVGWRLLRRNRRDNGSGKAE